SYSPLLLPRRPPTTPSLPYTTLFRSEPPALGPCDRHVDLAVRGMVPVEHRHLGDRQHLHRRVDVQVVLLGGHVEIADSLGERGGDRKSTRLNSSHVKISYAVFCLKKK